MNAVHELALQITRLVKMNDRARGITVQATVVEGGTATNVVPERARGPGDKVLSARLKDLEGRGLIVRHVDRTIAFYADRLGFETSYEAPEQEPFFAIVGRDGASLFVKAGEASPLPNPKRDPAMRWDAYCYTPDPDALAAEFAERGAPLSSPLKDTTDGLRGFEITDPDGYVLFFGRPRELS